MDHTIGSTHLLLCHNLNRVRMIFPIVVCCCDLIRLKCEIFFNCSLVVEQISVTEFHQKSCIWILYSNDQLKEVAVEYYSRLNTV